MIALRDDLPLVQYAGGEVEAFRRDWLLRSLAIAARRAGYERWWLAEHVVESITCFLRLNCRGIVVPLAKLENVVRSALQAIGYSEVATRFVPEPPIAQIDLPAIAAQAGNGYELTFFRLLAEEIDDVLRSQRTFIEMSGLSHCVKALRAKKVWCKSCATLREEIVMFTRRRLEVVQSSRDILFMLT